ncbi:MAG: GIY-YIG nuclease family protein [Anaerolineales bacterium]|nr:GIY-YIG nuclease family protein [Anaerolineales bacterium]
MKKPSSPTKGIPCCYVLRCADGSFYTGWTNDLPRRIRQHETGHGGRYTRSRRPVKLMYFERQEDKRAARRREAEIKKLPRAKKAELASGKKKPRKLGKKAEK